MSDGWKIVQLREVASRTRHRNSGNLDLVFTVSAGKGLIRQEDYFTKRVASKNLLNYFVVQPGEYVFNKSYSKDAPYGVIARNIQDEAGVVSPLYISFRANEMVVNQDFLGMALTSPVFWDSLRENLKEGGRGHGALNLGVQDFFDSLVPLPPLEDQGRIVDLVKSIDSYLAGIQKKIDTSRVYRNGVLHKLLNAQDDGWVETTLGQISEVVGGGHSFYHGARILGRRCCLADPH